MRIVMETSRVCEGGQTQQWGDIVDVPDAEAMRMIEAGQARRHVIETAMTEQTTRGGQHAKANRKVGV